MKPVIAVCSTKKPFQGDRIFDRAWCRKFPGATWYPVFADIASVAGVRVMPGDAALERTRTGDISASEILVVSEEDAPQALELIERGAQGAVLLCGESPFVVWRFYDRLPKLAQRFRHVLIFGGADCGADLPAARKHQIQFCCFDVEDVKPPVPWAEREFLCMVASLRLWVRHCGTPEGLSLAALKGWRRSLRKWMRQRLRRLRSPALRSSIRHELQTKRLEAFEYFGAKGRLAAFGRGWDDPDALPPFWRRRLAPVFARLELKECADKIGTMSRHRFAICFENIAFPGYVTEKIIDCFVAGVIPIYAGAPDISEFVPPRAYFDMRNFKSFAELERHLDSISQAEGETMITAGRDFLRSPQGLRHTHEEFARCVLGLALEGCSARQKAEVRAELEMGR